MYATSFHRDRRSSLPFEERYSLANHVPAIQILPSEAEGSRLGLMTQLPAGAEVKMSGAGFNDRTVRVECFGAFYYVFLEDLAAERKPTASATA